MTPEQLELRLELLDKALSLAYKAGLPLESLMECVQTLAYMQSIHYMHASLGTIAEVED